MIYDHSFISNFSATLLHFSVSEHVKLKPVNETLSPHWCALELTLRSSVQSGGGAVGSWIQLSMFLYLLVVGWTQATSLCFNFCLCRLTLYLGFLYELKEIMIANLLEVPGIW